VGHEHGTERERVGGDQGVERADGFAFGFEFRADDPMIMGFPQ
jgi:hypothetical protein